MIQSEETEILIFWHAYGKFWIGHIKWFVDTHDAYKEGGLSVVE
jgi:hypothetical protein